MSYQENYQTLVSLLQQEFQIYNDLYYVLDEEYVHLTESDTEMIQKAALVKEMLLKDISILEEERQITCLKLAEQLQLKETNLTSIASKLNQAEAKNLLAWRSTFDDLLKRLKEKNDVNQLLATSALNTVEDTIDVVKDALQTKNTYQKKGKIKTGEQVEHLFVKKG